MYNTGCEKNGKTKSACIDLLYIFVFLKTAHSCFSMKKALLILILQFPVFLSFSQTQTGFRGGINILRCFEQDRDGRISYSYPHPSYFISYLLRGRKPGWFNMGGELEYSHRSFKVTSSSGGVSGQTTSILDLNTDNIRIMIQPQFTFGTGMRIFFYPGIYAGYMFQSHIEGVSEYKGSSPYRKSTLDGSAKKYLPSWEFGCLLGFGLDFPLYKGLTFILENTETINLTHIYPKWESWSGGYMHIIEIGLSVGIAYTFPAKQKKTQEPPNN